MNDVKENACRCKECPGSGCGCGCQNAATKKACGCDAGCNCAGSCGCAKA